MARRKQAKPKAATPVKEIKLPVNLPVAESSVKPDNVPIWVRLGPHGQVFSAATRRNAAPDVLASLRALGAWAIDADSPVVVGGELSDQAAVALSGELSAAVARTSHAMRMKQENVGDDSATASATGASSSSVSETQLDPAGNNFSDRCVVAGGSFVAVVRTSTTQLEPPIVLGQEPATISVQNPLALAVQVFGVEKGELLADYEVRWASKITYFDSTLSVVVDAVANPARLYLSCWEDHDIKVCVSLLPGGIGVSLLS
jgi:hypothetical protein